MLYHLGKDHPYHSLYVLLALSNAGLDNEFPQKGYVTGQRRSSATTSASGGAAGGGGKLRRSSVKGGSGVGGQCVVDDVRMMRSVWLLYCFCSRNWDWGCPGGIYHIHTHTHHIHCSVLLYDVMTIYGVYMYLCGSLS